MSSKLKEINIVSKVSPISSNESGRASCRVLSSKNSPALLVNNIKLESNINKESNKKIISKAGESKWERNREFGKILIVCCVPILSLLIKTIIAVTNAVVLYDLTKSVRDSISFSVQISGVIHALQKERGSTALFVSSNGSPEVFDDLTRYKYVETDDALNSVYGWKKIASSPSYLDSRQTLHNYIIENRRNLDGKTSPIDEQITFFSDVNKALIQILVDGIIIGKNLPQWNDLIAFHLLIHGKEMTGKERAIGSTFFGRGYMPQKDLVWYVDTKVEGISYLEKSGDYSSGINFLLDKLYKNTQLEYDLNSLRREIDRNIKTEPSVERGNLWIGNLTNYINILKLVEDDLTKNITIWLEETLSKTEKNFIIYTILIVFVSAIIPITIYSIFKLTTGLHKFAQR